MILNKKSIAFLFVIVISILIIIKFISFSYNHSTTKTSGKFQSFKNTSHLKLTKHAKCRMECRHITLQEIKEIIKEGNENYAKSGVGSKGDQTYALEGYSIEHQHIRVVVAPENDELVVITCIDLDEDWPCNCN
ncbi:MAG: DUF4258 domain-containing protein [Ginsengibacter sp.]